MIWTSPWTSLWDSWQPQPDPLASWSACEKRGLCLLTGAIKEDRWKLAPCGFQVLKYPVPCKSFRFWVWDCVCVCVCVCGTLMDRDGLGSVGKTETSRRRVTGFDMTQQESFAAFIP